MAVRVSIRSYAEPSTFDRAVGWSVDDQGNLHVRGQDNEDVAVVALGEWEAAFVVKNAECRCCQAAA